jgi:integrase
LVSVHTGETQMPYPSYIHQNRFQTFYFRQRTPADIYNLLPSIRKEVKLSLQTKNKKQALKKARHIKVAFDAFFDQIRMFVLKTSDLEEYFNENGSIINKVDIERASQAIEDQRFIQQFSLLFERKDRLKSFFQRKDVAYSSINEIDLSSVNRINKFMAVVDILHANPLTDPAPYMMNITERTASNKVIDQFDPLGISKAIQIKRLQVKRNKPLINLQDPNEIRKRASSDRKKVNQAFTSALNTHISEVSGNNDISVRTQTDDIKSNEDVILEGINLDTQEDVLNFYKLVSLIESGENITLEQLSALSSRTQVVSKNTLKLSELFDKFYRERSKEWSNQKTHSTNKAIYKLCIEVIGDLYTDELDFSHANKVCDIFQRLPANRNKKKEYKDKSIEQLLAIDEEIAPMKAQNVNKYLSRLSEAFEWSYRRKYVAENIFKGFKVKDKNQKRKQSELRDRFNQSEIETIFSDKIYANKAQRTFYYWLPLLAIYSGARLQELCQLRLTDIKQTGKIWYVDINDDNENNENDALKQLKTVNAIRTIPLHNDLIKLGFIEYIQHLKELYEKQILQIDLVFPDLIRGRDGWGHNPSNWFARHLTKLRIKAPGKSFHSLRHTFADELKQNLSPKYVVDELLGHALEGLSLSEYGKAYSLETKKKVIDDYRPLSADLLKKIQKFKFWVEFQPSNSVKIYKNIDRSKSIKSSTYLVNALTGRLKFK